MAFKVEFGEKRLVFSAPINDATKKWGVYCIPRLWKEPTEELVIRLNGEVDSADPETRGAAPSLLFVSEDNGESWNLEPDGVTKYNPEVLQGNGRPYLRMADGNWIAIGNKKGCTQLTVKPVKEFMFPNEGSFFGAFPAASIPDECMGMDVLEYDEKGRFIKSQPLYLDFPDREIITETKAWDGGDGFKDIPIYVKPMHWSNPYISSHIQLSDGTVCGIVCGQNPDVADRFCGAVYLVASDDGGVNWKMRGVVAMGEDEVPYGYGGDGFENSLAVTDDGKLVCAMRMDVSVSPEGNSEFCETYVAISEDFGYTWSKPFPVAEASVTPQLVALEGNVLVLFYGRPGVHFKVSEDGGRTWSEDYRIIGKNYTEARALGIPDAKSKYGDMDSYSNVFVEKLSGDSVLVCFNDMKYDEGDGAFHRAAFVQKITVKKERK